MPIIVLSIPSSSLSLLVVPLVALLVLVLDTVVTALVMELTAAALATAAWTPAALSCVTISACIGAVELDRFAAAASIADLSFALPVTTYVMEKSPARRLAEAPKRRVS